MRKEYQMTQKQLDTILKACRPTPYILGDNGSPLFRSPQERANDAWCALGRELGFDGMTVKPVQGKDVRFFTAETTKKEEAVEEEKPA